MMLRFRPTRVTLTEDDLCYHIDSIFSRNDQLTKWHRQRTGSGNSYDGDDDEDGLFYDSDSFSVPETYYESECDETQPQQLAGGNVQETDSGNQNTSTGTGTGISSRLPYRRPVSVRFASPEPSPLRPNTNSLAVVRSERLRRTQPAIESVRSAHPRPPIPLPFVSRTDCTRLRGAFASQHSHLNSSSLTLPGLGSSRPTDLVVLEASLASLLSSIVALPVRISGREENPRTYRAPWLPHGLGIDQGPRATLPPEMKRQRQTKSTKAPHESESNVRTPEPKAQGCLTEITPNSGSPAPQSSNPDEANNDSTKSCSSTLQDTVISTISRATQTDPDLVSPIERYAEDSPTHRLPGQNHTLLEQENTVPREDAQPTSPRHWQDLFTSAMFPEPDPPAYDATNQIRRGMQGHIYLPAGRGRGGGNERDQLVHPTLLDATVFQEYAHRLITELDRAP